MSRYTFVKKIGSFRYGTTRNNKKIFDAVSSGNLRVTTLILEEGQRLDHFAGEVYGDSSLWWVIAAASGIGWGLQVPPGTIVRIPYDLGQVYQVIT